MPKIYTKTGDDGTSSLVSGERVPKYDLRLEAYGTIDELNSFVGWFRSDVASQVSDPMLAIIQHRLFNVGSILALGDAQYADYPEIKEVDILALESAIDIIEQDLPALTHFILPSNHPVVSKAHICRTICRRAERRVVALEINTEEMTRIVHFLNRLSDYFFVLARSLSLHYQDAEVIWQKR